ncbi:hypothetical protein [Neomegalonema perideroedes]|uniref:hypothetical protein n=1 Tax=Neomegalonema perideroedes TaxID=217219 RepID=UPI000376BE9B|nr:hypothetical protein [Neomegalonema perideroedes]
MAQINMPADISAIMPCYIWLADPAETSQADVLTAIKGLAEGVKLDVLAFSETMPFIEALPSERQRIVQVFVDHFEGRLDLPGLEAVLGD